MRVRNRKGATELLEAHPVTAIVELGANDGLRGLPVEEMRANLDAILTELAAKGIPTLLVGMRAPPNMGRDYGQAFQQAFVDLALPHDIGQEVADLTGVVRLGLAELGELLAGEATGHRADGLDVHQAGLAPELRERVLEGMARVEVLLSARVAADDPFVAEASGHLLAAGGKPVYYGAPNRSSPTSRRV